ncbi:hypothetical protein EIP91_005946 [Steccherinum ochraceum]|uniref:Uncharacterized protein n=1 Tax=Steccherinum ochraceum TaxID=92696 RepID=A0A4R0RVJ7_9APHY|nr:hypothetical protein EIP91_005946 [Steccherinum ochraceum]
MSTSIQSNTSQSSLAPSSTSTSHVHPHRPLLAGPARLTRSNSSKQTRGRTLGLIDAARVRLSKDFPALLRSSSLSSHTGTSLPTEAEESDDQRSDCLDYANEPPSARSIDFAAPAMEHRREERTGRSLGSRKRRSQSLDDAPISEMPTVAHGGSLGRRHVRHSSSNDEYLSGSSSTSKPATRHQSRPISSTTTATNTTVKPRPKKLPEPKAVPGPDHHVHIQTEILPLEATGSSSSRKGKKLNIFSMAIPARKPPTISRPTSPVPERSWTGRFRSGSSSSQVATKVTVKRDTSNSSRASRITPSPHTNSHFHATPPPVPKGNYSQQGHSTEAEDDDHGGRCSPLCGLPSPTLAQTAIREKGKEREGMQRLRDKDYSVDRTKEKGKEKEKPLGITGPRRVGSPILRERERDSRTAIAAVAMEKVPSGSGYSRRSSKDPATTTTSSSVAAALKARQIKHGSFDFERPMSSAQGHVPVRSALRNIGHSAIPMQRSSSLKVTSRTSAPQTDHSRGQTLPQQSTGHRQTDSFGRSRKPPRLDVKTDTSNVRRGTDSSVGSTNPPSTSNPSRNHVNFVEPETPNSSQSGGGSWGRNTGKHVLRGSHGAFKFEPAVPPIPGSPADDRKGNAARSSPKSSLPPSKLRQERAGPGGVGRSLDLNLGLSWAPSKVREEAVLLYGGKQPNTVNSGSTGRARARWKSGWVDEEGRLGSSSSRPAGSDVAEAFEEALGPAAYSTFKTYVHRFDAHAIPLDGPYGLVSHAKRLLDSSSLSERRKQVLMDRFIRFVENNQ